MAETVKEKTLEKQIVVFSLAGKEYGLPVEYVTSIERVTAITRVPNVRSYIKGVINLRGIIVPVIDLRRRFAFEETPYTAHTRILIIAFSDITVGLVVDAAKDVIKINSTDIEEQPDVIGVEKKDFINGVVHTGNRLIILLDLPQILELAGADDDGV